MALIYHYSSPLFGEATSGLWILLLAQLILLVRELRKGPITGVGGFLFMSFCSFPFAPYILALRVSIDCLVHHPSSQLQQRSNGFVFDCTSVDSEPVSIDLTCLLKSK